MADTADLKSAGSDPVPVRVRSAQVRTGPPGVLLFGAADPNGEPAPATAAKPPSAAQRRRVRSAQVRTGPLGCCFLVPLIPIENRPRRRRRSRLVPRSGVSSSRTAYRSRRRFLFQSKRRLSLTPSLLLSESNPLALGFDSVACFLWYFCCQQTVDCICGCLFRFAVQMRIDICCGRVVAVPKPFLNLLHRNTVGKKQ